jgi:hydroxymethylbilane synthase
LEFVVLRGNVKTRLTKLEAGAVDAIVLAQAGLRRLDLERVITHTFPVDILVPSAGQGILVGEYLKERQDIDQILQPLSSMQAHALFLERAFLEEVEGHCGTPVGIYCVLAAEHVEAHMVVAAPDGTEILQETLYMPFAQAEQSIRAFGAGAKNWLKDRGI